MAGKKGFGGPKCRTETEREAVMALVAKLDRRGWSQFQIRDEVEKAFGLRFSQPSISNMLKELRERYRQHQIHERREAVHLKIEQYAEIRREAWLAYEKSMEDEHGEVEEFADDVEDVGMGDRITSERRIKRIVSRKGRLPANQYLTTIMQTLQAERDLLGLDEEVYQNVMAIEEARQVVQSILDAQREVLADQPDVLAAIQQKYLALAGPLKEAIVVEAEVVDEAQDGGESNG